MDGIGWLVVQEHQPFTVGRGYERDGPAFKRIQQLLIG
jgi:hypothetical protein